MAINAAFKFRNVVLALDIILIIRRIFVAIENAAMLLIGMSLLFSFPSLLFMIGTYEEEEAKYKIYNKDMRPVNMLPKEIKAQREAQADRIAQWILKVGDTVGQVKQVFGRIPALSYLLQNLFLVCFLIAMLVLAIFLMYLLSLSFLAVFIYC